MSIFTKTIYELYCNGMTASGYGCYKAYQPPEGLDHRPRGAELRRLAAEDGWIHVRSSLGRALDRDYCCQEHKPADEHRMLLLLIASHWHAVKRTGWTAVRRYVTGGEG